MLCVLECCVSQSLAQEWECQPFTTAIPGEGAGTGDWVLSHHHWSVSPANIVESQIEVGMVNFEELLGQQAQWCAGRQASVSPEEWSGKPLPRPILVLWVSFPLSLPELRSAFLISVSHSSKLLNWKGICQNLHRLADVLVAWGCARFDATVWSGRSLLGLTSKLVGHTSCQNWIKS